MSIVLRSGDSLDTARVNSDGQLEVALGNAVVTPAGELKVKAGTGTPFGALLVTSDPNVAFTDTFEGTVLDTVNRWRTYGTVAPTQVQGHLELNPGSTPNATTTVVGLANLAINMALILAGRVTLETDPLLGAHRFWGLGAVTGDVGTAANPLTDAVGFEVDTTGSFNACVYAGGVRVFHQPLTWPTDGLPHLLFCVARGDVAFFYIDTIDAPPLAVTQVGPDSQNLPFRMHWLNGGAVVGDGVMIVESLSALDQARQSTFLSDGIHPWRKATVDTVGALLTTTRSADLVVTAVGAAGQAVTATLPAAGSGLHHYITKVSITRYATAAITGNATPSTVTTTNLPGALAWTAQTAAAVGTLDRIIEDLSSPLRSSAANTNSTIVCPATTNVIWRVTVHYYVGT